MDLREDYLHKLPQGDPVLDGVGTYDLLELKTKKQKNESSNYANTELY